MANSLNQLLADGVKAYLEDFVSDNYFDTADSIISSPYANAERPSGVKKGWALVSCVQTPVVAYPVAGVNWETYTVFVSVEMFKYDQDGYDMRDLVYDFNEEVVEQLNTKRTVLWDAMAAGTQALILSTNFVNVQIGDHLTDIDKSNTVATITFNVLITLVRAR